MARRCLTTDQFWKSFQAAVDCSGGPNACWPWRGLRSHGYGIKYFQKKREMAHRLAWVLKYGDLPADMCVCHKCDNPPCCNPRHLFLGSKSDNMADKVKKDRQAKGKRHAAAISKSVPRGEFHHAAVLTAEIVRKIRIIRALGLESLRSCSIRLGISYSCVSEAARGITWKHV